MRRPSVWMAVIVLATAGSTPFADEVIFDDLIVHGSCCIGETCEVDQDFLFDTLRLRGDVLRLGFVDTSTTAAFPTNDWQIAINDADGDGEANRFSIEDVDSEAAPFTIEAGAPNYAIYVNSEGQIGIGTPTPEPDVALDVRGSMKVDGAVDVTGSASGLSGVKAGIIPRGRFSRAGRASVTFDTPYEQDYMILLTAVSRRASWTYKPTVVSQNDNGFTLSLGGLPWGVAEVHWMTQAVGE